MKSYPDEIQRLIREMGEAGMAEMARSPGLAAAVDQHAAAVRDVITASGEPVRAGTLLDYLYGFADAALDRGWRPEPDGDFCWESLRVLAAYRMVRDLRRGAGR